MKDPDIFTRYNQVFAQNETLKRELAEANHQIALLRESLTIAVQAIEKMAPDSIIAYCLRLQLDGEVGFVARLPDPARTTRT
jgi:hypothetical protein